METIDLAIRLVSSSQGSVSGSSGSPIDSIATSDLLLTAAIVLAIVMIASGLLLFRAWKKSALNDGLNSQSKQVNYFQSAKKSILSPLKNKILVVICLIAIILSIFTAIVGRVDSALAGQTASFKGSDVIGYVDEATGNITFSDGTITNIGDEDAIVSQVIVKRPDGIDDGDCAWTLKSGNVALFNGVTSTQGTTNYLEQELDVMAGSSIPLSVSVDGLSIDKAKSLIDKNVVSLGFILKDKDSRVEISLPKEKSDLTYNGKEQFGVSYDAQYYEYFSISGVTSATDASDYQAIFALNDKSTTKWADNTIDDKTINWSIAKATPKISNLSCADVYYGETPVPDASTDFGTPTFSYASSEAGPYGNWSTTNNPGTYWVKASVAEADNWKASESAPVSFEVIGKTITVTPYPAADQIYTGEALDLGYISTEPNGCTIEYSVDGGPFVDKPIAVDAGTYTVTYKATKPGYYDATATFSAKIIPVKVDVPNAETGLVYSGFEQVGVNLPEEENRYTLSNNTGTNAGSYSASATLTDKNNYVWNIETPSYEDEIIDWSIEKATPNITNLTCDDISYGETPAPDASTDFGTPTFSYATSEAGPYGNWSTTNNPGTYWVKASVAEADNWKAEESAPVSFEVIGKIITVTAHPAADQIYTGDALDLGYISTVPDGCTIEYSVDGGSFEDEPTTVDAGTHNVAYKASKPGYNDATGTFSAIVSPAKLVVPQAEEGLVYNGKEQTGVQSPEDAKYTLSGNTAKDASTYTATASLIDKNNYEWNLETPSSEDQSISWKIEKANATIGLDPSFAEYTVPAPGSFKYEYVGDGEISVSSSDESVAGVSIDKSKKEVTVMSLTEGNSDIAVNAAEGINYFGVSAVHKVTVNPGTISVDEYPAKDLVYNGVDQSLGFVTTSPDDCTIEYKVDGTAIHGKPTAVDAGTYKVDYQVSKTGYTTLSGTFSASIDKATPSLKLSDQSKTYQVPTSGEFSYDYNGDGQIYVESEDASIAKVDLVVQNGKVSVMPIQQGDVNINVYSEEGKNYFGVSAVHKATVNPGTITVTTHPAENLTYNKTDQMLGYVTTVPDNCDIKYSVNGSSPSSAVPYACDAGNYVIKYTVSKLGYNTEDGEFTVKISKATPTLVLSSDSANYQVPNSGNFSIEYDGDGDLDASSEDSNIASVELDSNIVNVCPKHAGNVDINVKSEATNNYNGATATHRANVAAGKIDVKTFISKDLVYNFDNQLLGYVSSYPENCNIKYWVNGTSQSRADAKKAGKYTVVYEVSLDGYDTEKSSFECEIAKRGVQLDVAPAKADYKYDEKSSFNYTTDGEAPITCKVEDPSILDASINQSEKLVDVSPKKIGTTKIILESVETDNFVYTQACQEASVIKSGMAVQEFPAQNLVYTGSDLELGYVESDQKDSKIEYKVGASEYSEARPLAQNAGTHTVKYKVTKEGYNTVEGSFDVEIAKAVPHLELDASSSSYVVPDRKTVNISYNGDGNISAASSDSQIASVALSEDQSCFEVSSINQGQAAITISASEGNNYLAASVTYIAYVSCGNIEVEEFPSKDLVYNKQPQELGYVKCSPQDCNVVYSLDGKQYSTDLPVATNADSYTVSYQVSKFGYNMLNGSFPVTLDKSQSSLTLIPDQSVYTFPDKGYFSYTYDGDGDLNVSCAESKILQAQLDTDQSKVFITPLSAGSTDVILSAGEGQNYKSTQATHKATVKNGSINVDVVDASGLIYDKSEHVLGYVVPHVDGCDIKYSVNGSQYSTTKPTAINAGTYKVDYQVSKDGYDTVSGDFSVAIDKAMPNLSVLPVSADYTVPFDSYFTYTYDGDGIITMINDQSEYCEASMDAYNCHVNITPIQQGQSVIQLKAAEGNNYKATSATHTATINNGTIEVTQHPATGLVYNGYEQALGKVTTDVDGCTVKYNVEGGEYSISEPKATNAGTYTVGYKVEKAGYTTEENSFDVSITKADPTLILNPVSATYNISTAGYFTYTYDGDGKLSAQSDDTNIVTAALDEENKKVAVTPVTAGMANITVNADETTNYNAVSKTHIATVNAGPIDVTPCPRYGAIYTGDSQDLGFIFTNPSDCTVVYSVDGGPFVDSATAVEAGMHNVAYKATKPGYTDATGTFSSKINKKDATLTPSKTSDTYIVHMVKSFTYEYDGDGEVSVSSSDESIATASVDVGKKTVTVTPKSPGEAKITINAAEGTNFNATNAVHTATVEPDKITVTPHPAEDWTYDGTSHSLGYITTSPSDCKIEYRLQGSATWSEAEPTATNAGRYKVYYRAWKAGHKMVEGSFDYITVNKKSVTVTADDKSKMIGKADPEFTATVTGLVGTDKITYSIPRELGEQPGTYIIYLSGAEEQGNYKVAYYYGTFTIKPPNLIQKSFVVKNESSTAYYTVTFLPAYAASAAGGTCPYKFYIYDSRFSQGYIEISGITDMASLAEKIKEYGAENIYTNAENTTFYGTIDRNWNDSFYYYTTSGTAKGLDKYFAKALSDSCIKTVYYKDNYDTKASSEHNWDAHDLNQEPGLPGVNGIEVGWADFYFPYKDLLSSHAETPWSSRVYAYSDKYKYARFWASRRSCWENEYRGSKHIAVVLSMDF